MDVETSNYNHECARLKVLIVHTKIGFTTTSASGRYPEADTVSVCVCVPLEYCFVRKGQH